MRGCHSYLVRLDGSAQRKCLCFAYPTPSGGPVPQTPWSLSLRGRLLDTATRKCRPLPPVSIRHPFRRSGRSPALPYPPNGCGEYSTASVLTRGNTTVRFSPYRQRRASARISLSLQEKSPLIRKKTVAYGNLTTNTCAIDGSIFKSAKGSIPESVQEI